jgi:hypothetical protein
MTALFHIGAARRVSLLIMIGAIACLVFFTPQAQVAAQVRISPTPVSASLPLPQAQSQPIQQEEVFMSPTPSATATEDPTVTLERNPGVLAWNVYNLPDPEDGTLLGSLEEGVRYPVTGIYFEWLQFQYEDTLAWIHQTEVIVNNDGNIPPFDPYITPTPTSPGADAELTRAAVTLTPGAFETLDAEARLITLPELATQELENAGVLPTFTKPAEVAPRNAPAALQEAASNAFEETISRAAAGRIPPLVPILMLAGAGLLGMLGSLWRR